MIKKEVGNGYFEFGLKDILIKSNISINKLMRDTNTDFKVIKRIMDGNISTPDLYVLARFCNYLNCRLSDLIEYKNN